MVSGMISGSGECFLSSSQPYEKDSKSGALLYPQKYWLVCRATICEESTVMAVSGVLIINIRVGRSLSRFADRALSVAIYP
jgi:hypothetical protein